MIIKPDLNFKIPVVKFLLPQNIFFISQKEKEKQKKNHSFRNKNTYANGTS